MSIVAVEIDARPCVPNHEGWWDAAIAGVSSEPSVNDAHAGYQEAVGDQRVVW